MTSNTQMKQLVLVGVTAAFATLAFLGTTVIRIPIPASGGYFNLGDTFVMAAALLYGPLVGGLVGAIGPAMADALGFPQFILATAVVKGVEGILIGLIVGSRRRPWRAVIALAAGVLVLVGGYYLFEAYLYPLLARRIPFFGVTDAAAALAEVVPNLLQGGISAVIAFGIWKILARSSKG
ncbi:MAG: ECF transporter S component [Desulfobacteraceae bacterium]|nr:ECF transporter S component [Desulfobacteraceae bacterium]MBC2751815.1 ECF transporter S component [Desulfobacteraceae bacterium]